MFEQQSDNEVQARTERWNRVRGEVGELKDRGGTPMDERIQELVAALRVNGIETQYSCEGHIDIPNQRDRGPSVGVINRESQKRWDEIIAHAQEHPQEIAKYHAAEGHSNDYEHEVMEEYSEASAEAEIEDQRFYSYS